MSEPTIQGTTLRQAEENLDKASNRLDLDTDPGFRATLKIIGRTLTYIRYFKLRFFLKFFLFWLGLLTPLVLPWPIKIVIDNVILGLPMGAGTTIYPPYFVPFTEFLVGQSPFMIMTWVLVLVASWVLLFGAFGTSAAAQDATDGVLAQGHDTATQTENDANEGYSKVSGLIGLIEFRINIRLSQSFNHLIRSQLFSCINSLPMSVLNEQRIGDSVYRVMYDTPALTNVFYQTIMSPIGAILTFMVLIGVMSYSYGSVPELIWLAIMMLPVQFIAMIPFSRSIRRRSQASRSAGSVTTGNIEEGMSNVLAVQSLGGNKRELQRFNADSKESFKRFRNQVFVQILVVVASGAGTALLGYLAFYLISSRVIEGVLTTGDYGVLFYYYIWLSGAVRALPYVWLRLQHSIPGIRRVFFIMDLPSEIARGGRDLAKVKKGFRFDNVSYRYSDGRRALSNISLEMKTGQIVALVGATGAGKTTLAYLLPGFYEPSEGRLLVDDIDVREVSLKSLRREVSYVFQETQLFSDTILDNIRYGKRNATLAEVQTAARIAGAHDFVMALPDQYETSLGTVSSKLSVGQKQRISIARGLLKESSVLVLDEPTSALDPETEAHLVEALHAAAKDKLVVIIAHRLSTITHADKIVFLEQGVVMEEGSHNELMARENGHYRSYVMMQGSAKDEEVDS